MAPVAAYIMEDPDSVFAVAQQDQGNSQKVDRFDVAGARHIAGHADAGPGAREKVIALETAKILRGIGFVRQAAGFGDGMENP
jgi:hypothetical protein